MDYNLLAMHLNTDVDDKSIGTESYRDIRNMRPYKGRYETIEGNRLLVPTTRTVIGSVYDSVYECNYFLLKDDSDEHAILRVFRTGEYDYILDNQGVLNFKKEISHIDVIDGRWLSFTDGYDNGVSDYNPPRLIDIHMCDGFTNEIEQKTYKRGQARSRGELVYLCINDDTIATGDVNNNWRLLGRKYTTISSNHITRAKNEPYAPPSAMLVMNSQKKSTNLVGSIYKFAYTYTYVDGSESRLSPYSDTMYPMSSINKIPSYYFNEIHLSVDSGDELVTIINLHVMTEAGVWYLFKSVNKTDHLGNKIVNDNVYYSYIYEGIDTLTEVIDKTGFNAIPQSSTSSCFSSVGRIIDGNTTEFYDYQDIDFSLDTVESSINIEEGKVDIIPDDETYILPSYDNEPFIIYFHVTVEVINSSLPAIVYLSNYLVNTNSGYPQNAIDHFVAELTKPGISIIPIANGVSITTYEDYSISVSSFYIYVNRSSVIKTYTPNTELRLGISYYDSKGRTAGVFSSNSIYIPSTNDNYGGQVVSQLRKYDVIFTLNSKPPSWAKSWVIVASKNNPYYKQWLLKEDPDYSNDDYIKFKSSWTYEAGDTLIIRHMLRGSNNIPLTSGSAKYQIYDSKYTYPILKADGEYIYIPSDIAMPYAGGQWNPVVNRIIVEARRKDVNNASKLFVETNSFGTINGDKHVYRGLAQTNSLSFTVDHFNTFVTIKTTGKGNKVYYNEFTDDLLDISILDGRPSYEDKTIRRTNFRNRLRWTGVYVPNGGINKLNYNKFTDYIDLSSVHGSINHVGESNGIMSVKQNRKTTSIYVGKQGLTQAAGENYDLVVSSETVLGSRYESRTDIGCINPESYVKTSSGSYFFDKIGGRIVFDSQSGLQDISTGFINELIKGKQTIQSAYIGAPYYEVWFYLGNEIVVWSERDKKWIYRVDVSGIEHITNSDIILTCKDGIWVHDSSVRKLYNISINNKVSIQVSPVVRSTAKTLAVVASDSVDMTLSDSARLTNTPHGLAKKKDDIWYYPIRRFGDVHNGIVPRFDTALLTLSKQSVLPINIHQVSIKLI